MIYIIVCEEPNYITKNNRIVAQFKSGREVIMNLKGVNWLGMQDNKYVPKGLWDGDKDGNTLVPPIFYTSINVCNPHILFLSDPVRSLPLRKWLQCSSSGAVSGCSVA